MKSDFLTSEKILNKFNELADGPGISKLMFFYFCIHLNELNSDLLDHNEALLSRII